MIRVQINFKKHPCTNHTGSDYTARDEDCDSCSSCRCDEEMWCCGDAREGNYCSQCADELERPYCYYCEPSEKCPSCEDNAIFPADKDVVYTGTVTAEWRNGDLVQYDGYGHPHLDGTYCLGDAAPLFEDVTTREQALEAIVTHISNVDFADGLGGPHYSGIEVAS